MCMFRLCNIAKPTVTRAASRISFYLAAAMQARSSHEIFVRLSVYQTRELWQNKRNFCLNSYTIWKIDASSFLTRRTDLLGDVPFYLKFWIQVTHPLQNGDFQSTVCSEKRDQNVSSNIFYKTRLGQFWWNLVHSSWINLPRNYVNVFHITWVMSLHYLVKLKMLIAHVLPLSC